MDGGAFYRHSAPLEPGRSGRLPRSTNIRLRWRRQCYSGRRSRWKCPDTSPSPISRALTLSCCPLRTSHSAFSLSPLSAFRTPSSRDSIIDNWQHPWLNRNHRSKSGPLGQALRVGKLGIGDRTDWPPQRGTRYPVCMSIPKSALTLVIN